MTPQQQHIQRELVRLVRAEMALHAQAEDHNNADHAHKIHNNKTHNNKTHNNKTHNHNHNHNHKTQAHKNKQGWIGFERFMQRVLYSPGLGYYANGSLKFAAGGDFITAPELGNLFATCLARQCAEVLAYCENPAERVIVEFGAGTGKLALDLLTALDAPNHQHTGDKSSGAQSKLPSRYFIVETSADLIQRQGEMLANAPARIKEIVCWVSELPARVSGVILANELLDAMAVKCFEVRCFDANQRADIEGDIDGDIYELGVAWRDEKFVWQGGENPLPARLSETVAARLGACQKIDGYRSEIGLQGEAWVRSMAGRLEQGAIIVCDYGFSQAQYYHPDRVAGTLMCHYQHTAHADPFANIGLQDVTAHVNFSAIAAAGIEGGLDLEGYATQAQFLLSLGLLEQYEARMSLGEIDKESLMMAQEIKKLTLPHEMGELFKVMAFSRGLGNLPSGLSGFARQNNVGRL